MNWLWSIYTKMYYKSRSEGEVIKILNSLIDRTISDEDFDDFISVKCIEPELEKVRIRLEELWVEGSPYYIDKSIDPRDLNQKGILEIKGLIKQIEKSSDFIDLAKNGKK